VTAHHFFVSGLADVAAGGTVELSAEDSRHALRSLRLRPGEDVSLADGSGLYARARLVRDESGRAVFEVMEVESRPQPRPALTVAMAPPKGDRLAWSVQKLAEVGVDELLLMAGTERAVRRPDPEQGGGLDRRLARVAREAAMQSRRPFVMPVGWTTLEEATAPAGGPAVLLWEGATVPLREAMDAARESRPVPDAIRLVVGPEGGFSDVEIEAATVAGARIASLGPGILRTETAALVAAALALDHLGRLG
jgi:16S rRNA (uracil1498-N3)-methyltransferase